jgi:uncharacterized protein (TIRG00374 family)
MFTRAAKLTLVIVASAAILAVVVYIVGFEETLAALLEAGVAAFLAPGAVLLALLALQAAAWDILGRVIGHRVSYLTLFEAVTVGQAGNIVTPSTYLGGEPAKIIYAGRRTGLSYQELTGTVLLAKYLEALSFVVFLGAGTAAAAVGFRGVLFRPPNVPLGVAVIAVAAGALGLSVVLWVSLSRRWQPLSRAVRLVARTRLFVRFLLRLRKRAVKVEQQVSRVFCEERKAVVPTFCLYLVTHAVIFVKPLAFFYLGWRLGLGLAELGLIFVTCQVLLAVQLTPSGAGTLDGGLIAVLALARIPITAPQCAAFLLCVRFWDAVVVGAGALLAARAGAGLFARRRILPED